MNDVTTVYNEHYLAHYGVLGMKWGQRKKQARAIQRELNKSEKNTAKKMGKYVVYSSKAEKMKNKLIDRHIAGKTVNKKSIIKQQKLEKRANLLYKDIKKDEGKVWKKVGQAVENHYDVDIKHIYRASSQGRRVANVLLMGPLIGGLYEAGRHMSDSRKYEGSSRYSVKTSSFKVKPSGTRKNPSNGLGSARVIPHAW